MGSKDGRPQTQVPRKLSFWTFCTANGEWIGTKFPDALLFQEGLVGTLNGADTEVPAHRAHPARTRDRVPRRYHYMLGEENWRMHMQSFAHLCKQQGIVLLATGFIEDKEKE